MNIKDIETCVVEFEEKYGTHPSPIPALNGAMEDMRKLLTHIKDLEAENKRLREDKTNLVLSSLNLMTAVGKAESKDDINHPVLKLCKKHMGETIDALSKDNK